MLLAAVLLSACGASPDFPVVVRMGYHHEMVSLDPHGHNDGVTGSILSAVYEPLVTLSPESGVEPALASSWTTPDDTTWRFVLRDGVRFHSGRVLTAEDVVESVRRARYGPSSALTTYMEVLEDVRVVPGSPEQVEISTVAPFPLLLTRIAMVAIVPAGFDPQLPEGTGPYQWVSGNRHGPVLLRRFKRYWGPRPDADEVRIRVVDSEEELLARIVDDAIDVMARVDSGFVQRYELGKGWRLLPMPSVGTTMLALNVSAPPLDDVRIRREVDRAIDRGALVAEAFPQGMAEPAWSLVPAGVFGFAPPLDDEPGLEVTGGPGRQPVGGRNGRTLHLLSASVSSEVVDHLCGVLASIGLTCEIERVAYEDLYRRIEEGSTELYVFSWNFRGMDASDFLDAVVHSRDPARRLGGLNGAGFRDADVDRWIEEAAREPRAAQRLALLRKAFERVRASAVYLPLYHRSRLALVREPFTIEGRSGSWVQPQEVRLLR